MQPPLLLPCNVTLPHATLANNLAELKVVLRMAEVDPSDVKLRYIMGTSSLRSTGNHSGPKTLDGRPVFAKEVQYSLSICPAFGDDCGQCSPGLS
mmetsp:Transcript_68262/g.120512  ORF Transcript_68262/g.120512 Transcript_68262/m.120512 type:complete len:95 (-) Transcript_68262:1461-1745(-)